jgi:hypothetical protein
MMLRLASLLAMTVFAAGCSGRGDSDGRTLPLDVQEQLPLDVSFGNLCPGAGTPGHLRRDLRMRAEVLLRELHNRPDYLVTYTLYTEEEGPLPEDITVRELAERQLLDLREGGSDYGDCAPDIQRKLEEAL